MGLIETSELRLKNLNLQQEIVKMLKVCKKQCDQCLFSPNKIVSAARKTELLKECRSSDSHFVCHKTEDAVCAGFRSRYQTNLMRIAERLNAIEFVTQEVGD